MNRQRFYAGIGSRETPPDVLLLMTLTAKMLSAEGFTLRSGGAEGADTAFAQGATHAEIFKVHLVNRVAPGQDLLSPIDENLWLKAREIAAALHPGWKGLGAYAKDLHTRNSFQILGSDLATPSEFVVCWTPDGKASGGTGQAIRLAVARSIPVYNLHDKVIRQHYVDKFWRPT